MENASKALMIAGGVLVAIMVLSLAIFGYSKIRHYQEEKDASKKLEQVVEYNKKFDSYNKGVVTGYEIISLTNLAQDTNERYEEYQEFNDVGVYARLVATVTNGSLNARFPNAGILKTKIYNRKKYSDMIDYIVTPSQNGKSYLNAASKNQIKEFKEMYFQCDGMEYDTDGRVIKMYFSQIHKEGE